MAKWIEEIEICTFIYILYAVAAQLDDMGIMQNSEENSFSTILLVKELLLGDLRSQKPNQDSYLLYKHYR